MQPNVLSALQASHVHGFQSHGRLRPDDTVRNDVQQLAQQQQLQSGRGGGGREASEKPDRRAAGAVECVILVLQSATACHRKLVGTIFSNNLLHK